MRNSKITKAYDKIVLDEISKQKIYSQIKEEAYGRKIDYKNKIWNYKKLSSIVAVCACAIMVLMIPGVQANLQNSINKIASWISGNSKDDYYEEVDSVTENNNMKLTIVNAQRRFGEVRLRYEITFPVDIENLIDLNDYNYKEVKTDTEEYLIKEELFSSKIFEERMIYINDISYDYISSDKFEYDAVCYYASVENVKIDKNKLIQELVIQLNEQNMKDDINIKLEFYKFNIDNKIYDVNLRQEYTVKGDDYSNTDIKMTPLSYLVQIDEKNKLEFYGYSYTRTGIKLYSKITGEKDLVPIIRLIVKDNYGTEYMMYPWWTNQKYLDGERDSEIGSIYINSDEIKDILIFEIYDGPADLNNEYPDYWNDNIKNLNIKIFVEDEKSEKDDEFIQINNKSDFIINFENENNN